MNKSFEALVADMKELAEHILELEAEKYQEREMIEAYDRADTLFGAVNIKALIAALEREVDIREQNLSIKLHMAARIAELESLYVNPGVAISGVSPQCVKLPHTFCLESFGQVRLLNYADTVAAIRAAGGTVEGGE